MSTTSATSSKLMKSTTDSAEVSEELESLKSLNKGLMAFLGYLTQFKKNLVSMDENCKQLSAVNKQWIETLSDMK